MSAKPSKFFCLCVAVIIAAKCVRPVRRIGTNISLLVVRKRFYERISIWCTDYIIGNEYLRFGKVEEKYGVIPTATFYPCDAVTAVIIPAEEGIERGKKCSTADLTWRVFTVFLFRPLHGIPAVFPRIPYGKDLFLWMYEQFYKRAVKLTDGRSGKADVSLAEGNGYTIRAVKKL